MEAEFEEEKKLHEQKKDDEFDKLRSKSANRDIGGTTISRHQSSNSDAPSS